MNPLEELAKWLDEQRSNAIRRNAFDASIADPLRTPAAFAAASAACRELADKRLAIAGVAAICDNRLEIATDTALAAIPK